MFRRYALVGTSTLVLLGLVLALTSGPSHAHLVEQIQPASVWDEGQQATANATQADTVLPAVAVSPGTSYRTFSGTRFQPTASTLTYLALGGAVHATALPSGGFSFSLDFDLPAGATMTEVVFFVVDNDATNMELSLRSYNPETNAFITLESATSSGASPALQSIVIPVDPPVQVSNTTTSYRLRAAPGVATSAHLLRGARIGYTIPQSLLPVVAK